ncbi:MAG: cytochrome C oxidase subunit I [Acidobacteria bacterium]|nr:MAG: cytochrome C oxidase subunit I [Acidobacteriota bacterium]
MQRSWLTLSVVSLGLGGFLALVAAVARAPMVYKLVPPEYFYHAIIGHVDLAIVGFFLTFTLLLWSRTFKVELKTPFYLSLTGILLIAFLSLSGLGKAVSNNYLPTIDHPLFWLGAILFFLGFWVGGFSLWRHALRGLTSKNFEEHLVSLAVFLSLLMLLATFTSLPKAGSREELYLFYERLYWAPGHVHQFINGTMLLFAWYSLLKLSGVKVYLDRLRYLSSASLLFCSLYVLLPVVFEDPVSRSARTITDVGYALGLGLPIFFHLYVILKNMRQAQRGIYFIALVLSVVLYLLGVGIAYAGLLPSFVEYFLDPTTGYKGMSSTLSIPAHYHGVITSQTLAFMALGYSLLKELGYTKRLSLLPLSQVYMYGVGMVLFVLGLFFAGLRNAPRKTYGTAYTDDPTVLLSLGLMLLGTLLAVFGGILFVLYSLRALTLQRSSS